ncbi:MAG: response regulator [Candidatus Lokiarchaeota archaeon]|nr:response regulator [Candidatus Lokiarchaeota archaeon]
MSEEEIRNLTLSDEKIKRYMRIYQEETDKYAIWRGAVTEGFKKWLKGEKVYTRAKERISLYVADEVKTDWQNFINVNKPTFPTFSELIRQSVNSFIEDSSRVSNELSKLNPTTISNISHALKEPLTSIKGYSQLLLESDEYRGKLSNHIEETIKNIFDQSNLLENIIKNFLDNIKPDGNPYDILLIEDDLPTIRLITNYFENKDYVCKGVVSGTKGLEELKRTVPKVILLDIILPDISGYDICQTIKTDNSFKKIPIFFLTAISESEVTKNFRTSLADGYILKPFNFSDFDVIFEILNRKAN